MAGHKHKSGIYFNERTPTVPQHQQFSQENRRDETKNVIKEVLKMGKIKETVVLTTIDRTFIK